jgi:hypothetical protein
MRKGKRAAARNGFAAFAQSLAMSGQSGNTTVLWIASGTCGMLVPIQFGFSVIARSRIDF